MDGYMYAATCACMYADRHANAYAHAYMHTHTRTHARMQSCMHACVRCSRARPLAAACAMSGPSGAAAPRAHAWLVRSGPQAWSEKERHIEKQPMRSACCGPIGRDDGRGGGGGGGGDDAAVVDAGGGRGR